jgi:uncharacterized membrane protein
MRFLSIVSTFTIALFLLVTPVQAQSTPVVHGVFFYNPDCESCQQVMTVDLPPLKTRFGSQLDILEVNTSVSEGMHLYQAMVRHYQLAQDRLGTPAIVIGSTVLVGSDEIPLSLPGLIEDGLANGGVNWPSIPGLDSYIAASAITNPYPSPQVIPQTTGEGADFIEASEESTWEHYANNFKKDPLANGLAVIILVGMVISLLAVLTVLVKSILAEDPIPASNRSLNWLIPLLLIAGMAVAGYLSYVEVAEKQAICGPVGNCNAVQSSSYAKLFGFLHIGVLGLIGYAAMLVAWGLYKLGSKALHTMSALALWGMSLFGVAFSIYLTFLEPFVIGATCMWCLSSALIITALLWITTPIAQESFSAEDFVAEEPQLPEN